MRPDPMPEPLFGAFVQNTPQGEVGVFVLQEDAFALPRFEKDGVVFYNVDAAWNLQGKAAEAGEKDQLLFLAAKALHGQNRGGLVWKGKPRLVGRVDDEEEGVAHFGDFREPEYEIISSEGVSYLAGRDWAFPHVEGLTSWHKLDLTSVSRILEKGDAAKKRRGDMKGSKFSDKVDGDVPEALLARAAWGFGSSVGHVGQMALPSRNVTAPCVLSFRGAAVEAGKPEVEVGIVLQSSDFYFLPLEAKADGGLLARVDALRKMPYHPDFYGKAAPFVVDEMPLTRDLYPEDEKAAAWFAREVYGRIAGRAIEVRERDPKDDILLNFKFLGDVTTKRPGDPSIVGAVFQVEKEGWFVPGWKWGVRDADQAGDSPRLFILGEAEKIIGKLDQKKWVLGDFSMFGKPGGNVVRTLRAAVKRKFRKGLRDGSCEIR